MESNIDMLYKNCCRLCLSNSDTETLKSVFEESERNKALRERILAFLSVEIKENDKLPTTVCDSCIDKIVNWSEYRRSCFKNQTTLENWAGKLEYSIHDMSIQIKEEVFDDVHLTDADDVRVVYSALPVKTELNEDGDGFEDEHEHQPQRDVGEINEENDVESQQYQLVNNATDTKEKLNVSTELNDKKIEFAAGLRLIKSDTTPISMENLSKIETSYIEKCKAMVVMYRSLVCACHNVSHPHVKGLLTHLRSVGIWFPVFTCYHCMITFTDRSSSGRHLHKCPNKNLETLIKLSNLKKRSPIKTRIYQNYRCADCKFLYSFHEDFCKHIDEEHCDEDENFDCSKCGQKFETVENYKKHVYVSCLVEYYCDFCGVSVKNLNEFIVHAETNHDQSEGFALLQDDNYKRRSIVKPVIEPRENKQILGKRRSSTYGRSVDDDTSSTNENDSLHTPPAKKIKISSSNFSSRNIPTKCLKCDKIYSCYANMMRHYRKHRESHEANTNATMIASPNTSERVNSLYRCPDCHSMHNAHDWKNHKMSHEPQKCDECDQSFTFKTELDAHRVVHLNLKVYRDSKTHAYKSTSLLVTSTSDAPVCDVCNIVCENFEDLESHKLSHEELDEEDDEDEGQLDENETKYSCIPCNKHYTGYSGLWDHNKKKHSDKQTTNAAYPRQCDECEKIVTSGSAFASHKAMHRRVRDESVRITTPQIVVTTNNLKNKMKKTNTEQDEDYFTCKRCFKVFSSKYNLRKHMILHGINMSKTGGSGAKKNYTCESCNVIFNNSIEYKSHLEEDHKDEENDLVVSVLEEFNNKPYIFTCDICVQTFTTKHALKLHKEMHAIELVRKTNKNNAITCKYCKIPFENVEKLNEHMTNEHDEQVKIKNTNNTKGFACKICKKTFLSQPAMYAHQGWHKRAANEGKILGGGGTATPKFTCVKCRIDLPNDTALKIHFLEKHGNIKALLTPKCESCNQEFATQTEYENHEKLHEIVENQKKLNKKPSSSSSSIQQFPCNLCNSVFSKIETLQAHMRLNHRESNAGNSGTTTNDVQLKCQYCGRVFEKLSSLNNHMKVHEKQNSTVTTVSTSITKPLYFCSICSMGFSVPKELRSHTITAHPF